MRPRPLRLCLLAQCVCLAVATTLTAGCGLVGGDKASADSSSLDAVKARGELRVAAPVAPPFVLQRPGGKFEGLDIKLTAMIADELGVDVTYLPADFQNVVAGLQADKYDLIPALCVTKERDKVIDFTDPTTTVSEVWAVPSDSGSRTVEDLNDPKVTIPVATGSLWDTVTTEHMPNAEIKRIPGLTMSQGLQAIQSGRADAIAVETPFYPMLFERQLPGELRYIPGLDQGVESCPVAWGVKQDATELQDFVNEFFGELKSSGDMDALLNEASEQLAAEE